MRLPIVLLAIILFLLGLSALGQITLKSTVLGWLYIADALFFILDPIIPVVPVPWRRAD